MDEEWQGLVREGDAGEGRGGGLVRRGELANQSSGGKGSTDRDWKGLGWANREEGEGVVGLTVVGRVCLGLVLSCLMISCLILSCWRVERDGETKTSDGAEKRGA